MSTDLERGYSPSTENSSTQSGAVYGEPMNRLYLKIALTIFAAFTMMLMVWSFYPVYNKSVNLVFAPATAFSQSIAIKSDLISIADNLSEYRTFIGVATPVMLFIISVAAWMYWKSFEVQKIVGKEVGGFTLKSIMIGAGCLTIFAFVGFFAKKIMS